MKLDFEYGQGLMSANLPDNTDIFVPGETVPDPECLPQDWDTLYAEIGNPYGTAALMGNLFAESSLRSNNLQDSYEAGLGYTDVTYTQAVDDGRYANFTSDQAGYGLAQWTVQNRKSELLAFANERGGSISDLDNRLATWICSLIFCTMSWKRSSRMSLQS